MKEKACWGLRCPQEEVASWREMEDHGDSSEVYWTPIRFPISIPEAAINSLCALFCHKGLKASYHLSIGSHSPTGVIKTLHEVFWVVNVTHLSPNTTLEPNPWHIIPETLDEWVGTLHG